MIYYMKYKVRYRRNIYHIINKVENMTWISILAILHRNGALTIHSKLEVESYNLTPVQYPPFNETVTQLISTMNAITVTDTFVRRYNMGRFWIITNSNKSHEINLKIYSK